MWAIRQTSVRIKSQPFSPVTFRVSYAKFETASSIYTDNNKFSEPPSHISDRSVTLKRFYSKAHGGQSQTSFIGKHSFSSLSEKNCSGEEDDEFKDSELISEDGEDDVSVENDGEGRKASSGLFKAIVDSSSMSVKEGLSKWLEEGNYLSKSEISHAMSELQKRRMYSKALQLSQLFEANGKVKFEERDYATRVDLLAKTDGLHKAEFYMNNIVPSSFRRENVYQAFLANCVFKNDTKKAEQVFNEIKKQNLPITTFACEQMLLLYKRTDRRKMAEVVSLMEKENIKQSVFTYRFLIDAKGQSNDVTGMEKIVEKMKGEGLEPDFRLQAVLARHYANLGIKEKAKFVLKEMEGENLNENRKVCSYLLPIYASLGSEYDVKRVWEVCESDPSLHDCMNAIDAFGKLKKVEEAEAVFDKMLRKWKQVRARPYAAMLKLYAYDKMLTEGENLVKRMNESGCGIGPDSLDALVIFYVEAGEVEEADLILNKVKGKPRFTTYMLILREYGKRGDVYEAERIFDRMRVDGYKYVSILRQYNSLLQAYINAKSPTYGWFRMRLQADGVVLNKSLEAQLAQLDAFKYPTPALIN